MSEFGRKDGKGSRRREETVDWTNVGYQITLSGQTITSGRAWSVKIYKVRGKCGGLDSGVQYKYPGGRIEDHIASTLTRLDAPLLGFKVTYE